MYIFTFLDYPDVPFENNFAERQIRPAVILRKNSQSNRSDRGATTQAVLMSVYRTLRLCGLNPTRIIADALKSYLTTGQLSRYPTPPSQMADLLLSTMGACPFLRPAEVPAGPGRDAYSPPAVRAPESARGARPGNDVAGPCRPIARAITVMHPHAHSAWTPASPIG